MLYWFTLGRGRRYLGVLVMLFAALLLAIVAIASYGPLALGPVVL
ncbi:MAG: hypothetical protein WCB27_26880 [Thermoguttaceae bacterium]